MPRLSQKRQHEHRRPVELPIGARGAPAVEAPHVVERYGTQLDADIPVAHQLLLLRQHLGLPQELLRQVSVGLDVCHGNCVVRGCQFLQVLRKLDAREALALRAHVQGKLRRRNGAECVLLWASGTECQLSSLDVFAKINAL